MNVNKVLLIYDKILLKIDSRAKRELKKNF